ncbi:MAG: magnesium transporter [Kiritimatiellae bacterium]|nr:magnesium transporter [Kiritimatiellia bacterium]
MNTMPALLKAVDEGRVIQLASTTKDAALRELAAAMHTENLGVTPTQLLDAVFRREIQSSAYLGHGVAIPHARAGEEGEAYCAIGWSPNGIQYDTTDEWSVHLILMYCVPASASGAYLAEIAALAKAIRADKTNYEIAVLSDFDTAIARLRKWLEISTDKHDPVRKGSGTTSVSRFLLPDITEMIEAGRLNDTRIFLSSQPAPDVAEMISDVEDQYRLLLFRLIPRRLASEVFSLLDYASQDLLVNSMAQEEARQVISTLSPDDRTALFEELPANVTQRLLSLLSEQDRKQSLALLSYPRDSVGRLMTNRYIAIRSEWTVEQAMAHIRATGSDSETMAVIYITDEEGVLLDDVRLHNLILAEPSIPISNLQDGQFAVLTSVMDREEAVTIFKKYDLYALPVVDEDGVLLGIVTSDDMLDVSEEEATEDFHKGVAVRPMETGYLKTPLLTMYRSRIPWLLVLVFINVFSGAGIAYFEALIGAYVALVFFLPLLIDSGGNAGSQSATLIIRSMALGELSLHDFFQTFGREILVSVGLGLSMAVAVFFLAWWRGGARMGLVVSIAMTAIVITGNLIGMLLPFIFRKLRMDPAVASGPLVTSLVDILGVLIYFGTASAILTMTH